MPAPPCIGSTFATTHIPAPTHNHAAITQHCGRPQQMDDSKQGTCKMRPPRKAEQAKPCHRLQHNHGHQRVYRIKSNGLGLPTTKTGMSTSSATHTLRHGWQEGQLQHNHHNPETQYAHRNPAPHSQMATLGMQREVSGRRSRRTKNTQRNEDRGILNSGLSGHPCSNSEWMWLGNSGTHLQRTHIVCNWARGSNSTNWVSWFRCKERPEEMQACHRSQHVVYVLTPKLHAINQHATNTSLPSHAPLRWAVKRNNHTHRLCARQVPAELRPFIKYRDSTLASCCHGPLNHTYKATRS